MGCYAHADVSLLYSCVYLNCGTDTGTSEVLCAEVVFNPMQLYINVSEMPDDVMIPDAIHFLYTIRYQRYFSSIRPTVTYQSTWNHCHWRLKRSFSKFVLMSLCVDETHNSNNSTFHTVFRRNVLVLKTKAVLDAYFIVSYSQRFAGNGSAPWVLIVVADRQQNTKMHITFTPTWKGFISELQLTSCFSFYQGPYHVRSSWVLFNGFVFVQFI